MHAVEDLSEGLANQATPIEDLLMVFSEEKVVSEKVGFESQKEDPKSSYSAQAAASTAESYSVTSLSSVRSAISAVAFVTVHTVFEENRSAKRHVLVESTIAMPVGTSNEDKPAPSASSNNKGLRLLQIVRGVRSDVRQNVGSTYFRVGSSSETVVRANVQDFDVRLRLVVFLVDQMQNP